MGFNYNKISIEKFSTTNQKISLKSNLDVSNIKKIKSEILSAKEKLLGVDFNYSIDYEPNFAKIEFKGNILIAVDSDQAEKVEKEWENKKIPDDFKTSLFNLILRKTSIKALELEDQMGIPLHMAMPKVQQNKNNKKE